MVLERMNRGAKNFKKIQEITGLERDELISILKDLEKRGLMKVEEKSGLFGPKVELYLTDKGSTKIHSKRSRDKDWVYDLIKEDKQIVFVAEVPGPDDKIMVRLIDRILYVRASGGFSKEVVIENKSIKSSEVMGPNVPGKKIGISGDTRPIKKLEVFFKNCDYLVFDSTFSDELKEKAVETCHSTAKEAATFAKNANVSNLILTHFSARYKDENVLLDEAKTVHSSVIAAHDQLKIDIV